MFAVLDTNHFQELTQKTSFGQNLEARIDERRADIFTCIVAAEETVQGWLALVKRKPAGREQIIAYGWLQRSIEALGKLDILPFDNEAALVFHRLRDARIRVGTMDLKIASICIAHEAMLLTRNLADFEKVPGLRVENWLD